MNIGRQIMKDCVSLGGFRYCLVDTFLPRYSPVHLGFFIPAKFFAEQLVHFHQTFSKNGLSIVWFEQWDKKAWYLQFFVSVIGCKSLEKSSSGISP